MELISGIAAIGACRPVATGSDLSSAYALSFYSNALLVLWKFYTGVEVTQFFISSFISRVVKKYSVQHMRVACFLKGKCALCPCYIL